MDYADKLVIENILEEYKTSREQFLEIQKIAVEKINAEIKNNKIKTISVSSRVKEYESLSEKLFRKIGKYHKIADITDILGIRIITFFADDVDKVGKIIESIFDIDWNESVDKREQIAAKSFGYLSLHYICSLKRNCSPSFCASQNNTEENSSMQFPAFRFEIQIRTGLQHIWAEIEHDIGYKSKFGIPRQIERQFSKVASLLEIADDEFIMIRDGMTNYIEETRAKISNGDVDGVLLNLISLEEYMTYSKKMNELLKSISKIGGMKAEISKISPENYISQFAFLGKKTLADIDLMIEKCGNLALKMAAEMLDGLEIDILSSNVGFLYLCRAELVLGDYSKEKMIEFFLLTNKSQERAEKLATQMERWKNKREITL